MDRSFAFETLRVSKEGAVLFASIAAPPMNLLGPDLVRDMVSLIQQAEADDGVRVVVFKSADPDYFISHVDVTKIKEYRAEAAKLTGEASIALLRSLAHRVAAFPAGGQVAVKERVNAIGLAPVEDFRRDSDLFGEGVRKPEAQGRIEAAMKHGFQTRDAEKDLGRWLGDLADR